MTKWTCPNCGSGDVCPILYGLPDYTDELAEKLEAGKVSLGGCIIDEDNPTRHCNTYDIDF